MGNAANLNFLESFLCNRDALTRYVSQIVPANEAEDIVQATFAKLLASDTEKIRAPRALIFTTARNLAIDHLRKHAKVDIGAIEDVAASQFVSDAPSQEDEVFDREELEIVLAAIAELPPKCQQVFRLRRIDGLSHEEISRRLGISTSAIEQHITKGIAHCTRHRKRMKRAKAQKAPEISDGCDPAPAKVKNV